MSSLRYYDGPCGSSCTLKHLCCSCRSFSNVAQNSLFRTRAQNDKKQKPSNTKYFLKLKFSEVQKTRVHVKLLLNAIIKLQHLSPYTRDILNIPQAFVVADSQGCPLINSSIILFPLLKCQKPNFLSQ